MWKKKKRNHGCTPIHTDQKQFKIKTRFRQKKQTLVFQFLMN